MPRQRQRAGKGTAMKKNGFTLIELLVVIVIIAILATLLVGGASYAVRVSREKRRMISCQTLQTAIYRYRTEYNEWPMPSNVNPSQKKSWTSEKDENKEVFGKLRASNKKDNPDGIHFIDETAFFTPDNDDGAMKLSETTGDRPLVFIARSGQWMDKEGNYLYYRVTIDFDDDTVTVDTWGKKKFSDGYKTVDLFYDEDEAEAREEDGSFD